jgi:hypothetical protein
MYKGLNGFSRSSGRTQRFARTDGVTSQKAAFFIVTALRAGKVFFVNLVLDVSKHRKPQKNVYSLPK